MMKETVGTVTARIALLEVKEKRLALLIQFPPPSCRNVALWRRVEADMLCSLRQLLSAQREELARMKGQLELGLGDASLTN